MSAIARTSAATRESSPVPQNNTSNAVNEAYMKSERKKLSGKLFRLDSPAKGAKQTAPTQRPNGEGGKYSCKARGQRRHENTLFERTQRHRIRLDRALTEV